MCVIRGIARPLRSCLLVALVAVLWPAVPAHAQKKPPAIPPAALFQRLPSQLVWTQPVLAKPLGPPVVAGERIFLALESGVTAYAMQNGHDLWTKKIDVEGPMTASADRLIVPAKGEILVLDVATGEPVWRDQPGPLTAPALVHGDSLFIAAGEQLTRYNLADGARLWTQDVGAIEQRPAVGETRVYVPAADGRLVALELSSGKPVWTHDVGIKPSEPLLVGTRLFVGSGAKVFCSLRALDGVEEWCPMVGAAVFGVAAADAQHVYFVAFDNLLHAHDVRNGAYRWKGDLRNRPAGGPMVIGVNVLAPSKAVKLQAFDAKTGKSSGDLTLGEALVDVPVFLVPPDPTKPATVVTLTGGLKNAWTLALAESPPPPVPVMPTLPLTELPGQPVPRSEPPVVPPGPSPPGA